MSTQRSEARRRQRLLVGLIVVLCAASAGVGVLIAATHPAKSSHHHHNVVFAILIVAGVAGLAAGTSLVVLRRQNRRPAMQRLLNTDTAQRRATARAVQKGEPLTPEQRDIAQALLDNLVSAARRMTWLLPASIATLIVVAVHSGGGLRVLWIVLLVFDGLSATALLWVYRIQIGRHRRALARPSSPE